MYYRVKISLHLLNVLQVQESAREKYEGAIASLQTKIHGLETQCEQHAVRQTQLTHEVTLLRSQTLNNNTKNLNSTEIQTGNSLEFAPSSTSSPNQSPCASPVVVNGNKASPSPVTPTKSSQRASLSSKSLSKSPAAKSPKTSITKSPLSPAHSTPIANKGNNSTKKSSSSPGRHIASRT